MYNNEKNIPVVHYSWKDIDKIELPEEILKSFARALVPEFRAYMQKKREQEIQNSKA